MPWAVCWFFNLWAFFLIAALCVFVVRGTRVRSARTTRYNGVGEGGSMRVASGVQSRVASNASAA